MLLLLTTSVTSSCNFIVQSTAAKNRFNLAVYPFENFSAITENNSDEQNKFKVIIG